MKSQDALLLMPLLVEGLQYGIFTERTKNIIKRIGDEMPSKTINAILGTYRESSPW